MVKKSLAQVSRTERQAIIRDFKKKAKEYGTTIGLELGEMVFGPGGDQRNKIVGWQIFLRDVLPHESHSVSEVTQVKGPMVYLPEAKPVGAPTKLKAV